MWSSHLNYYEAEDSYIPITVYGAASDSKKILYSTTKVKKISLIDIFPHKHVNRSLVKRIM